MTQQKAFLITIDTEADNQWDSNQPPTTENAKFLPRFQELCEKYNFKPTWLTTYEMANDSFFVEYFKEKQDKGLCEIGMHLHAWNTPPDFSLKRTTNERSYLIEYPENIMDAKIATMTELLTKKFGKQPIVHRAGRWAMNEIYFKLLEKYGYKVDCSVTPGINWCNSLGETGMLGPDYSNFSKNKLKVGNILELPMTVQKLRFFDFKRIKNIRNLLGELYRFTFGRLQWLRPGSDLSSTGLIKLLRNNTSDYAMFMIHSSELMPGGSPNFKTDDAINRLYNIIDLVFSGVVDKSFSGITLSDYGKKIWYE